MEKAKSCTRIKKFKVRDSVDRKILESQHTLSLGLGQYANENYLS